MALVARHAAATATHQAIVARRNLLNRADRSSRRQLTVVIARGGILHRHHPVQRVTLASGAAMLATTLRNR